MSAPAPEARAYARGHVITTVTRWVSLALGLLALALLWNAPSTRPRPALAIGLGYAAFTLAAQAGLRRWPRHRGIRIAHDFADATAVAGGAAVSGGLDSPIWLLLYPQVVAVSVRGGMRYALMFGLLDAGAVLGLAGLTENRPVGALHAISILWCAFMGGTTSASLKTVRARLAEANTRLAAGNAQLSALLEVGRGILERVELSDTLPLVARSVNQLMGTHSCLLLLREGDRLRVAAQEGLEAEVVEAWDTLRLGESLSGWVGLSGERLAIEDMRTDPRIRRADIVAAYGYRSYLCVPLKRGGEVLGTLEVVTRDVRQFGEAEQELMAAFAGLAAVAIDNARLLAEARAHLEEATEINRRLEDLDRLRKQYLRNVSHEFRTPLTVVRGYAEYLRDAGAVDEGTLRAVMRTIMESSERVIDMVDTLIEVSRVEQADAAETLQVQRLELESLVRATLEPMEPVAGRKGVELALEFPGGPLLLHGDEQLLRQLVRQLVDNAVKFSPAGTRAVVRGRDGGEAVELEVEDRGIGIGPEHLARIFDKFYMVEGGVNRRVGGTGVGLYLAREVARLHGGDLQVTTRLGEGSRFLARLPRQPLAAEPRAATG